MATDTEERKETALEKEIRVFVDGHDELRGHTYRRDIQSKSYDFLRDYKSRIKKAKTQQKKQQATDEFLQRLHGLLDYLVDRPNPHNRIERALIREFLLTKMTDIAGRLS